MKTTIHTLAVILVVALLTTLCSAQEVVPADKAGDGGKIKDDSSPKQPNIIIYMVDDLGWNHISAAKATMGTHKGFYHTPNIERLARNGVSFTHAYQQPNCAPTRAAMLTGQYPARIHNHVYNVGDLNRSKKDVSFRGPEQSEDVAPESITIAEALKKNGYATAHIGKYHVGGMIIGGKYFAKGSDKGEPLEIEPGKITPGGAFGSFINAVRANDPSMANGNVMDAHRGCVLGHLMNNSYRLGEKVPFNKKAGRFGDNQDAAEHFGRLHDIMANGVGVPENGNHYTAGPMLTFDPETERFTGEHAEAANPLVKDKNREGFAIPEINAV